MMGRLNNKIAILTGASTGIGAASAKVLANEGAHVLAWIFQKKCMTLSKKSIMQAIQLQVIS